VTLGCLVVYEGIGGHEAIREMRASKWPGGGHHRCEEGIVDVRKMVSHLMLWLVSALIAMYAKHGIIPNAQELFFKMHDVNIVSWNGCVGF